VVIIASSTNVKRATVTVVSTPVTAPLPDFAIRNFLFVVAQQGIVTDIDAAIIIRHTWRSDLVIRLEKVGEMGPSLILNRVGGSGDNFGAAPASFFVLDDEAPTTYSLGAPIIGSYQPSGSGVGPLSVFDGLQLAGTWRVIIGDVALADSGFLDALELRFTYNTPDLIGAE
jgi:subtilisin-like proprotein convertase family protein